MANAKRRVVSPQRMSDMFLPTDLLLPGPRQTKGPTHGSRCWLVSSYVLPDLVVKELSTRVCCSGSPRPTDVVTPRGCPNCQVLTIINHFTADVRSCWSLNRILRFAHPRIRTPAPCPPRWLEPWVSSMYSPICCRGFRTVFSRVQKNNGLEFSGMMNFRATINWC